jgi:hypothetical protein
MRRAIVLLVVLLAACSDDGGETAVTTTEPPGPTTSVVPPELSEHYACGYGVAVGSPDQTAGLFVYGIEADPPTETDLASDAWYADYRTGTNLFANWCTDLITDPQAEFDEGIQVTGGTIELVDVPEACGPPATVELHDVVLADGRELGNFTVEATGWACFAG